MGINYCWLSAKPSLPAKHIAFQISHCFSFMFLWFYPATHCRLPDFSSAARSIKQWVSWSASAWSGSETGPAHRQRGCWAVLQSRSWLTQWAHSTWWERPGTARSHSCSLESVDRFSPGDLFWICGLLLGMDILVKVLLPGKAKMRKRNTGLMLHKLFCMRYCKKKDNPPEQWNGWCDVDLVLGFCYLN